MAAESDEKVELKTAVHVDNIRPVIEGSICICGEGKRRQLYAIQNGSEHVHIYETTTRKGIIHLPNRCECMCVSSDVRGGGVGGDHLICCLKDGRVVHQSIDSFKEKKRKRKDKHKGKDKLTELHVAVDPLPNCSGDHLPGDQNIFGDLLGEPETKPYTSQRSLPPDVSEDEIIDKVVIVGDDQVIFSEPNVRDVFSVNGCLVTCAECSAGWTLSVYRQHVKGQSQLDDPSASHHAHMKGVNFETSPSFKTFLPGLEMSTQNHYSSAFLTQSRPFQNFGEPYRAATGSETQKNPQVFCIFKKRKKKEEEKTTEKEGAIFSTPAKTITVEDSLYNTLFGTDYNLLDVQAVLLICLPDGRIYQSPLRTLGNNTDKRPEPDRTGSNWSGLQSVFFVLDQPVATIHGFNTVPDKPSEKTKNQHPASDCLCIVGRYGRVVKITENDSADCREKLKFTESFTHGPVQACCKTRASGAMIYSTGKELYSLSLSLDSKKSMSSTTKETIVSCSFLLDVVKVRALAELKRIKTDNPGSSQLVALSTSGSVLKLNLPTVGSHENASQPITAAAAGKRMQESLQAINTISSRSRELVKLGETQDRILQEMSKASHLTSMLLQDRCSQMFSFNPECVFRNDGILFNMELLCKLTNHSQWSLSHGWSLTVSVDAAPDWTKVTEDMRYHVTKSMSLVDFRPMKSVEVIFPLHHGKSSLLLPVDVQCFLHFSPKGYISTLLPGKNENEKTHLSFVKSGISLPIIKPLLVDLLTVLRPVQEGQAPVQGDRSQSTSNRGSNWLASAMQSAARLRLSANEAVLSISGNPNDGLVSVCITLSSDVTAVILEHKNYGDNYRTQILRWLLGANTPSTQSTNLLSLTTPDRKVVTFEVKGQERLGATAGGSDTTEAVDVVITAPDYPTVTQLQLAVHRRIKVALEREEGLHSDISANRKTLQNELRNVQILQRKIQCLQDAMMQDLQSSTQCRTNAQETLKLHQQLRTQLTFM